MVIVLMYVMMMVVMMMLVMVLMCEGELQCMASDEHDNEDRDDEGVNEDIEHDATANGDDTAE
eukprot:9127164-Pyramimonas_sp.AAC.1